MKKLVMAVSVLLVCSFLTPLSYGQNDPAIEKLSEEASHVIARGLVSNNADEFKSMLNSIEDMESFEKSLAHSGKIIYSNNFSKSSPKALQYTPILMEAIAADADEIISPLLDLIVPTIRIDDIKITQARGGGFNPIKTFAVVDALSFAVQKGNKRIVEKLLASNPEGETKQLARAMAVVTGNDEMVDLLRKAGAEEPTNEQISKAQFSDGSRLFIQEEWANAKGKRAVLLESIYELNPGTEGLEGRLTNWIVTPAIKRAVRSNVKAPIAPISTPRSMPRPPMPRH